MKKLIIINGWAAPKGIWDPFIQTLSLSFDVHLLDWKPYEALKKALSKITEGQSFILCGWSLGSMEAIKLSVTWKDRIEALVLLSPSSCFIKHSKTSYECGWDQDILLSMIAKMKSDPYKTLQKFHRNLYGKNEIIPAPSFILSDESNRSMSKSSLLHLKEGLETLLNYDLRYDLIHIAIPVLILHGEHDAICPLHAGIYIHSKISSSRLAILKNTGHMPFYTQKKQCVAHVLTFLGETHD